MYGAAGRCSWLSPLQGARAAAGGCGEHTGGLCNAALVLNTVLSAFLSCLHYCESWPHLNKVSSPFTPQVRLFTWFFVGNRPGEGGGVTQFRSAPSAVEDFVVTFRAVDGSESFVHLGVQLRGCWRRQRWPSFVCLFVRWNSAGACGPCAGLSVYRSFMFHGGAAGMRPIALPVNFPGAPPCTYSASQLLSPRPCPLTHPTLLDPSPPCSPPTPTPLKCSRALTPPPSPTPKC